MPPINDIFHIKASHSGKVLAIDQRNRIVQATYSGKPEQHWRISPAFGSASNHIIRNMAHDLCFDLEDETHKIGKQVKAQPYHGGVSQQFIINTSEFGTGINAAVSGMALEIKESDMNPGAKVVLNGWSYEPKQLFYLLPAPDPSPIKGDNWMGHIRDEVKLSDLSIPGTHDSGAIFGAKDPVYNRYTQCQEWSIRQQLDNGIRYLDVRCRCTGTSFAIHHGPYFQRLMFGDILKDCREFLSENPSETLLMRIKEEQEPEKGSMGFKAIFEKYVQACDVQWYTGHEPHNYPTLGAIRNKIVVLDNAPEDLQTGIKFNECNRQDTFHLGNYDQKFELIINQFKAAMAKESDQLFLNHCTATALSSNIGDLIIGTFQALKGPRQFSDHLNPRVLEYLFLNECQHLGVVVFDFPFEELVREVYLSNKGSFH